MLETFLAQLHAWGRSADSHQQAVGLFGANSDATRLTVEATLTEAEQHIITKHFLYQPAVQRASRVESQKVIACPYCKGLGQNAGRAGG